jgi:hypothetical protein
MSDWWRDYQSGDTAPWNPDRWPDAAAAIEEAEAIVRQAPAERAEAAASTPEVPAAPGTVLPFHRAHEGPSQTYTRPDGTRVTEPIPPPPPVDPVRGLRLYLRQVRDHLGRWEPKP